MVDVWMTAELFIYYFGFLSVSYLMNTKCSLISFDVTVRFV